MTQIEELHSVAKILAWQECITRGLNPIETGYFSEFWSGPRERWEQFYPDACYRIRSRQVTA